MKEKFEKGDLITIKGSSWGPARVLDAKGDLTLVVKFFMEEETRVVRKDFCRFAGKLDFDSQILKVTRNILKMEEKIDTLENLREEVAEFVYDN